jgi:hypothetical protein
VLELDRVRWPERHTLPRAHQAIDSDGKTDARPEVTDELVAVPLEHFGPLAVAPVALPDRREHLINELGRGADPNGHWADGDAHRPLILPMIRFANGTKVGMPTA